jgi:hypothetical protein
MRRGRGEARGCKGVACQRGRGIERAWERGEGMTQGLRQGRGREGGVKEERGERRVGDGGVRGKGGRVGVGRIDT